MSVPRKEVIVSGANGFLGLLLLKNLCSKKALITALIHPDFQNDIDLVKQYAEAVVYTDFSDSDFADRLPKSATSFVHLAWDGVNGPNKGMPEIQAKNIEAALNAARAASLAKTERFIGIGTISENAYLNARTDRELSPSLVYGKYKDLCHTGLASYFEKQKTCFLWLRLANLYGATNKTGNILSYTLNELSCGRAPVFGPCDQTYDFVLAEDAVEAISRFALSETRFVQQTYFIGSGQPRLLKEYLLSLASMISPDTKLDIGKRPPDGLTFFPSDFECEDTVRAIGDYISASFEDAIRTMLVKRKEP